MAFFLNAIAGQAQTPNYFLVSKGEIFSQTAETAVSPLTSGADVFDVQAPGLGGPPLTTGALVSLPGGASQSLAYSPATGLFEMTQTTDTIAALDAAYPSGRYSVSLITTIGSGLTAAIDLPPDNFPDPPQVTNFAAAQSVDPASDFTLLFQAFSGGTASDDVTIEIDDGATALVTDSLPSNESSYLISANTLAPGKIYEGRLRFRHVQANAMIFPVPAFGFFSETRFRIATGQPSVAQTPPALLSALPADSEILPSPLAGLILKFNAGMDPAKIALQWTAAFNGSPFPLVQGSFRYSWSDPQTLVCFYGPLAGGWPYGLEVKWTLNPTPGNPANFADSNGNVLAVDTYHGSFLTFGGPWSCPAQVSRPLEAPAFFLAKIINYTQTNDATPVADPRLGAEFDAYFKAGGGVGTMDFPRIVALSVPVLNNPSNHIIQSLVVSTNDFAVRTFQESLAARSDLDNSYPAGNYLLELGTPDPNNLHAPFIVTNSVSMVLTNLGYPPIPHFSNFAATQSLSAANELTLAWDPFASSNASASFVTLKILDSAGRSVFAAPDACTALELLPAATSVTIPAGTLTNGHVYTVELTFGQLIDPSKVMPGVPGKGFTALERTTRRTIEPRVGQAAAPRFTRILGLGGGQFQLELDCAAGAPLVIEQTRALNVPFGPLLTTNPPVSHMSLTLPATGASVFWRARNP